MSLQQFSSKGVAAMVTLYNSEREVIDRISTYIGQVQKLYIVDNSDSPDLILIKDILRRYPNSEYINNNGNKGIAYALNVAAQAAIADKYDYLLLMDDDSESPTDLVIALSNIMSEEAFGPKGIVSAQSNPKIRRYDVQEVLTTITSGSLLSLRAYLSSGPFLNDLFIDWVDHEYSFRLRQHGYTIVTANHIKLKHRLGCKKTKYILGLIPIHWWSHSPVRLYYKFRNSVYIMGLYSKQLHIPFMVSVYYELLLDVIRVILLEDYKIAYIRLITRGLSDAYKKKLGRLPV